MNRPVTTFRSPAFGLLEAAFQTSLLAQLVIDASGLLVLANERARDLFGLTARDLGAPFQDLQVSYRPADLRSCVARVQAERRPIVLKKVDWAGPDARTPKPLEIHVGPLLDPQGTLLGVRIAFVDVTDNQRLQADLQNANREVANACEILSSPDKALETAVEDRHQRIQDPKVAGAAEAGHLRDVELFDFAPDGTLTTDLTGAIRKAHSLVAGFFGLERELLAGELPPWFAPRGGVGCFPLQNEPAEQRRHPRRIRIAASGQEPRPLR